MIPYLAIALLSKIGPSGVSITGTCMTNCIMIHCYKYIPNKKEKRRSACTTLPKGFILRNSGVLFETPIWKFFTSSISTAQYSAVISTFKAFLLVLPACNTYNPETFGLWTINTLENLLVNESLMLKNTQKLFIILKIKKISFGWSDRTKLRHSIPYRII